MTIPVPVIAIAAAMLVVAVVCVVIRLAKGPTLLDRVVAVDVLMAIIVCSLGVHITVTGTKTYIPVLIALTLLAFIGSVSVARLGPIHDHRPFEHGQAHTGQLPRIERRPKEGR